MARRYRKRQRSKFDWLLLFPIGIAVLVGVLFSLPPNEPAGQMPDVDAHLLITMSGWSPNQIQARAGVPIRIMLMTLPEEASHTDNIHSFILNETNTEAYVKAGDSQVFTLMLPKAGMYTFWCITCCGGVSSPSMAGRIVVT